MQRYNYSSAITEKQIVLKTLILMINLNFVATNLSNLNFDKTVNLMLMQITITLNKILYRVTASTVKK